MYILAVVAVAIVGFFAWCVYTAPRGYEDEDGGFHFESEEERKHK